MTTEPSTMNDFSIDLRIVEDPGVGEDSTGQRVPCVPASGAARDRLPASRRAPIVAAVAGLAIAAGAGALLVFETTSAPDPAPIPAPISPSDQALGYLFSADFPVDVGTAAGAEVQAQTWTPSPADQALGYLLSADFPVEIDMATGAEVQAQTWTPSPADQALSYLLSADVSELLNRSAAQAQVRVDE